MPLRALPWLTLLAACGPDDVRPAPVADGGEALSLADEVPFTRLEVPSDSRDGVPPRDLVPIREWQLVSSVGERKRYEAPLPVRPRSLFFFRPPDGMKVVGPDGEVVPHHYTARGSGDGPEWRFTAETITLELDADAPPPGEDYAVRWPAATSREAALNLAWSGAGSTEAFVRTAIQDGAAARSGLLLPAPAVASWELTVPPAAELHFAHGLALPETLDGAASDGARLVWTIERNGQSTVLHDAPVPTAGFEQVRLDLSAHAGEAVTITARTDPGDDARFDYVFIGEPAIASRKAEPLRVVLIFVDTLRPDHLGVYGHARDTSPAIDAFAGNAVVFEQARSVAPWTLPSARTLVTGRHPEVYGSTETLQEKLRGDGWATAMFAGNVYLSANFDMQRGWGLHHVGNWRPATEQVDLALSWLEEQDGRDALVLLHLMDVHLPYREPAAYERLFAGETPPGLEGDLSRTDILRSARTPAARAWVRDRYDNNIRYVDDELRRFLAQADHDDVVVLFSDHGEEFWEHGSFEHGHTLYDELLRVPLILKAPGLAPGRVAEPVSLLDVTPTLYDLLGLEAEVDGTSLLPAARGEAGAREALAARDLAFGRPLYGSERWGVLHGDEKYMVHEGHEMLFDLGADPAEDEDLLAERPAEASAPYRERLGAVLDREVHMGLRIRLGWGQRGVAEDTVVTMEVPGGVRAAWLGDEPTNASEVALKVDGNTITATWDGRYRGAREVFVLPVAPLEQAAADLRVEARQGEEVRTLDALKVEGTIPGRTRTHLGATRIGGRHLEVTYGVAPVPRAEDTILSGYDPELAEQLKAMGYAVGDEE